MSKKRNQSKFSGFHTPSLDRDLTPDISLPGQFETRVSPGAACYRPKSDNEPLLGEVPVNHSPKNQRNTRRPRISLPPLLTKQAHCDSFSSYPHCQQAPNTKDYCGCVGGGGSNIENVYTAQSPQPCLPLGVPSTADSNPSGASTSDIELAVNEEDGLHATTTFRGGATSRLSGRLSTSRGFNMTGSPNDYSARQPLSFPVPTLPIPMATPPPRTLDVEQCHDDSCDYKDSQCRWHYCVLKYPQCVKWQDEVRTVLLKRRPNEPMGFSTKALKCVRDAKEELYVLVDKMLRGSIAARSGLAVGDMILSVNGDPLQTEKKFQEVNFKRSSELKMQIQRPLQLLDKASEILKNLNKTDFSDSRMVEPLSPSTSPDQAPVMEQPFEAIPLLSMRKSGSRPAVKSHCLPQARIFLCGNCTLDFVRCMFGNLITVSADSQAFTYQISMEKMPDGSVRIDNSKAFSYMMEDPTNSSINVEIVAVLNDDFFLNLCSWMFTPRSVFIVTFDTKKLSLSNDGEMARLSALADTILSHIPRNSENLQLFGMKRPGDESTLEEVRTLFYTSLAASLPEPKIISPSTTDKNAVNHVQQDLFSLLTRVSRKPTVLSITANAIDRLIINPNLIVTKHELHHSLPDWIATSPDVNNLFQYMVADLKATGNLIGVGQENPNGDAVEFLIPCKFLECLAKLIQSIEKEPTGLTFTGNFPGLLREMDLLELFAPMVPCPPKVISYMRELNIVFPLKCNHRDSGFCESASFLLPYFIEDRPVHVDLDAYQEILLAECNGTISTSAFFHLLSYLSFQDKCVVASVESRTAFRICVDRCELIVHLEKEKNKLHVFSLRNQKPSGKVWLRDQVETSLTHNAAVGAVVWKEPSQTFEFEASLPALPVAIAAQPPALAAVSQPGEPLGGFNSSSAVPAEGNGGDAVLVELPPGHAALSGDGAEDPNRRLEEEQEQSRLLGTRMMELSRLHDALPQIYKHMSIDNNWERWAGYLGMSIEDVEFYRSIMRNRQASSGETFFLEFIKKTGCPLGTILSSLMEMAPEDARCRQLATLLWRVAWEGNASWIPH